MVNMKNKYNKIIQKNINNFLINEGWFSTPSVEIGGFKSNYKLIGYDEEGDEIEVIANRKGRKITNFTTGEGEKVKLYNPPREGELYFLCANNEKNHFWGFDNNNDIYSFTYDPHSRRFIDQDNDVVSVKFLPNEYITQLQGSQQTSQQSTANTSQNTQQQPQNAQNQQGMGNREDILKLNERNPISTALQRLVRQGYLNNSLRVRYLMNDLFKIGL